MLQNTLSIGNTSCTDYIADIKILRDQGSFNLDELEVVYRSIELGIVGHENEVKYVFEKDRLHLVLTSSRKIFDEENLVYGHQLDPPQWVKLGNCVWSGPKCLHKVTKLARHYPSLDKLFTKYLRVENATSETVLNELRFIIAADLEQNRTPFYIVTEALARRVTDLLLAFTSKSLTLSPSILEALRSGKFWPYHQPSQLLPRSPLYFGQITDELIIPDHEYFLKLFHGKFPVLKLTTIEVMALKPLFIKLEVENKFLSRCVMEIASANDVSLPAEDLSHALSKRARALFWYVSNSPKEI